MPRPRDGLPGFGLPTRIEATVRNARGKPVLILLLTLFAVTVVAQDVETTGATDIRLRYRYGFDGLLRPGGWTPLYLGITNLGDDIRGTLTVSAMVAPVEGDGGTTLLVTEALTLRRGESASLRFVLPIPRGGVPLTLEIEEEGLTIYREELRPPLRSAPDRVIVALGDLGSARAGIPAAGVAYPLMEHLPERWVGYLSADAVVLADPPLQRLTPGQLTALEEWLRRGGSLLILEPPGRSPELVAYQSRLWSSGSDEVRHGAVRLRSFGAGRLARINGEGVSPGAALAILENAAPPLPPTPNRSRRLPFSEEPTAILVDTLVYRYPSRWIVGLLLLTAFGALLLFTRPELRWPPLRIGGPVMLPLLLAFLLIALFSTSLAPPKDLTLEIQRYTPWNTHLYEVERDLLIMSSRRREYTVAPSQEELFLPISGGETRLRRNGETTLSGALDSWDRRFFTTWERRQVDLSVDLEAEDIRVANGEEFLIYESFLMTDEGIYQLGPVSPGQSRRWELASLSSAGTPEAAVRYGYELQREQRIRKQLQEGAVFVGWLRPLRGSYRLRTPFARSEVIGTIRIPLPAGAED